MGSLYRSSSVGAIDNSTVTTTPVVHHDLYTVYPSSVRPTHAIGSDFAATVAASLGHPPPLLVSSGDNQLRVPGIGPLNSASSSFLPNSLLFPLPSSSLGSSSSSFRDPSLSGVVSSSAPTSSPLSSYSSFSLSSFLPPPIPSFAPSSLASASFPSSSVTSVLPPSVSSVYPSSSSFFFPSVPSSSSSSFPASVGVPSSSSALPHFVPPPHCFPLAFFLASHTRLPSAPLSSASSFPLGPPPSPVSSSSFSGLLPSLALVDHQVQLLGLSHAYQSLARWFVGSGVLILRVLCALPFLTFFLILLVISPLVLLSS